MQNSLDRLPANCNYLLYDCKNLHWNQVWLLFYSEIILFRNYKVHIMRAEAEQQWVRRFRFIGLQSTSMRDCYTVREHVSRPVVSVCEHSGSRGFSGSGSEQLTCELHALLWKLPLNLDAEHVMINQIYHQSSCNIQPLTPKYMNRCVKINRLFLMVYKINLRE